MYIPLPITLSVLALCVATFLAARWQAGQPVKPENGPRMIPWTLLAVLSGGIGLLMLINLAVLAGLDTNRPF